MFEHWLIHRDLDPATAQEMRADLEDHLADALSDGKSVSDVTGPDLRTFADEWADQVASETDSPFGLGGVGSIADGLLAAACSAAFLHVLFSRSLTATVPIVQSLLFGGAALLVAAMILGPTGTRLRRAAMPQRRLVSAAMLGVGSAAVMLGAFALSRWIDSDASIELPAILLAVMAVLGALLLVALPLSAFGGNPLVALLRVSGRAAEAEASDE